MRISIVIPVLNEAGRVRPMLDHLEALDGSCEIVIVDGGSADGTPEEIDGRARLIRSPAGRAAQMNAGAAAAGGDVLLFLHCDTRVPRGGLRRIREVMRDPTAAGGGFLHRFDREDGFSRFISFSANCRARWWRLFFGDQAIFARREVFERMGGYPELPLFEDWELSRLLRAQGRMVLIEERVETSGRRIEVWGKWRCLAVWWGLSILYGLGVPAGTLKRFYPHVR